MFLVNYSLQIQMKRELFFKGDSGLTSPPAVPTVPPPQPPCTMTTTTPVTPSAPTAPIKPRIPASNQNDEDSNKKETRPDNNKDRPHHIPSKPKELDGYVGFANLPNQVYRKAVKKGFDFTLMVVG